MTVPKFKSRTPANAPRPTNWGIELYRLGRWAGWEGYKLSPRPPLGIMHAQNPEWGHFGRSCFDMSIKNSHHQITFPLQPPLIINPINHPSADPTNWYSISWPTTRSSQWSAARTRTIPISSPWCRLRTWHSRCRGPALSCLLPQRPYVAIVLKRARRRRRWILMPVRLARLDEMGKVWRLVLNRARRFLRANRERLRGGGRLWRRGQWRQCCGGGQRMLLKVWRKDGRYSHEIGKDNTILEGTCNPN